MIEHGYAVSGMSCAQSVTEEITVLPGVAEVDVDVATGRVLVRAETTLTEDDVRAAIEEAGFTYEGVADLVP
ncbi:Cu(2+)-exporting ATPase [Amycolatopsis mediterranei S699]|uniref:Cu(2+)-exporting ATPase n=2 Tax=Amycolatopsis mediterranei TaxID=33910 RepID=A0A0H3CW53_AMYMU|nr:heavy metal-associated domain-containing protein [Amycolatopsis mediterranei]ADJ42164.1 Cu(2+)-exporting ATPase [Amycolatopsis mediterranei U32]AEK38841.1 Cu(2+)-exporting ATPase [Amycolatopsis mediterranei S699]AFO73872.1 Cu(2+)-exporting ATPase [Amycolatopsis mediterranei S699]AGT81001.1 Cu(2+)-exporting ATPase [Amycolatopsis mediterranei RB]KDO07488.1 ATPase P [Amycolatopsis mediterranei]